MFHTLMFHIACKKKTEENDLVFRPGGHVSVVMSEYNGGGVCALGMSLFQMQSDVDEGLPVVPHLNGSVLTGGAHQQTVPAEIAGGGDGLESTET